MIDGIDRASSEAMEVSDWDDCGYENESQSPADIVSPNSSTEQTTTHQPEQPVKIRKKPGRKPNPASPALRKAQNRAAQRAFRERKEKHLKDLEVNVKGIKEHRDRLLHENHKLTTENEVIKAENWYLKGIVLSLQLVCLQHNLVIPQHCPHVNDQALSVLAQSIPESIASYMNVNSKNKLSISRNSMNGTSETLTPQNYYTQKFTPGSLIITKDGVHTVPNNNNSNNNNNNRYNNQASNGSTPYFPLDNHYNIPPLSPMTEKELTSLTNNSANTTSASNPFPQLPMQVSDPVISNLAAIQMLRLRLRLQASCVGVNPTYITIQPTLLQLTIPHDPRIDLLPPSHMRDRMILFRDQFDLDDCFRLLLGSSVFHGGDPAVAGNWELPSEFFEKYWFLTIDYNLRRYTNEWRKKQGLQELKSNIHLDPNEKYYRTVSSTPLSEGLPWMQANYQNGSQSASNPQQRPIAPLNVKKKQKQQKQQPDFEPVQLTNGYRPVKPKIQNQHPNQRIPLRPPVVQQQLEQQATESFLGSKDYNMLMTGLFPDSFRPNTS